jgi:hypothetical protein
MYRIQQAYSGNDTAGVHLAIDPHQVLWVSQQQKVHATAVHITHHTSEQSVTLTRYSGLTLDRT